jgi:hypothetical protein
MQFKLLYHFHSCKLYLFALSHIGGDTPAHQFIPNLIMPSVQLNAGLMISLSAWLDDHGHAINTSLAAE